MNEKGERKEKGMKERMSSESSVGRENGIERIIPSGNRLKKARSCPLHKGSK